MQKCPECKNEKEYKMPSGDPLHVYSSGPTVYETFICGICKGVGEISELSFAIYKARGGPAPPIIKGYE